ncbi:MAG: glycosyltransferase [Deltaproteobacteria bacterium]|nr:glycosyltransferase [Deltaproteobacteria bacterium]
MNPDSPLISIITVVRNAENYIENVIKEVSSQTYKYKEHIIIDGGSTDGTVGLIKSNEGKISYWLSEADTGIYDAMNKGIDAARGEWLYFFGADDSFFGHDTLQLFFESRKFPDNVLMILGNIINANGRLFRSRISKLMYFKNMVHHQGVFYRRRVFEEFRYGISNAAGGKPGYRISGDYELNLLLFLRGSKHIYLNETIARCGSGISMQGNLAGYMEEMKIRRRYLGSLNSFAFDICTLLRFLFKNISKLIPVSK